MQCEEIEIYLSGYVDDELPLQQRQLLEIHLETCADCCQILEDLRAVKAKTLQLEYNQPSEKEWKRVERHIFRDASRGLGWLVLIVWSIFTSSYGLYQYATAPNEPLLEKILVFSLFLGLGLLFLSVLSDRVRERRTDRYRGIRQ